MSEGAWGLAAICALSSASCLARAPDNVDQDDGALVFHWTIEGSVDAKACVDHAAATMEIAIVDADETWIRSLDVACDGFGATLTLPYGTYAAKMVLFRESRTRLTSTIETPPFVVGDAPVVLNIDVPESAFLWSTPPTTVE